jgi:hypothetical protein
MRRIRKMLRLLSIPLALLGFLKSIQIGKSSDYQITNMVVSHSPSAKMEGKRGSQTDGRSFNSLAPRRGKAQRDSKTTL